MAGPSSHPVGNIGTEFEDLPAMATRGFHLHREERRVFDDDSDFLYRCHKKVFVAFPLEHGCKQFDQSQPADWRLLIEPGAIGGDPHVDIAAKGWIPKLEGRGALVFEAACCSAARPR